jgi:LuxR family transcriptional regulator, maltose regulon positive regulatory protein
MSRRANRSTPIVVSDRLYTDDAFTGTVIGSPAWFTWLQSASTFYYQSRSGATFTAHQERRQRGGLYWVAYRRRAGRLRRLHLGKPDLLTPQRLEAIALSLRA